MIPMDCNNIMLQQHYIKLFDASLISILFHFRTIIKNGTKTVKIGAILILVINKVLIALHRPVYYSHSMIFKYINAFRNYIDLTMHLLM